MKKDESTPTEEEIDKVIKHFEKVGEKVFSGETPIQVVMADPDTESTIYATRVYCWFNPITGRGRIGDKKFHLVQGKQNSIIFYALLNANGFSLKRAKVIKLLGLTKEAAQFIPSNSEKINRCIKELRKTAGITKNELILNNGNITLLKLIDIHHPKPS